MAPCFYKGIVCLTEIIIQKIRSDGPVSFRNFMEFCLYHPLGYYPSSRTKFGIEGDFFTSPTITPVFGKLLTRQLIEIWKIMGENEFTLMEWGSGDGALAAGILQSARGNESFFEQLNYCIVERNEFTPSCGNGIKSYKSNDEIPFFEGCVISNELIDNFPVHVVLMQDELMEVYVDYKNQFTEILVPASEELKSYFDEMKISLPTNYRTEVNLDARDWLERIEEKMNRGFIITIDYGSHSGTLYHPKRNRGSLLCFYHHQVLENPYLHIGDQDITSHVNFSALSQWGEELGMSTTGYVNQLNFLRALGFNQYLPELEDAGKRMPGHSWMLQHFIFEMGTRIKVLIQHKGICEPRLSGLCFASPSMDMMASHGM